MTTNSQINGNGFFVEQVFPAPLGDPSKSLPELKNLFFGVELEVNVRDKDFAFRKLICEEVHQRIGHFTIFTTNGAIPFGFEIKTAPATYEYPLANWEPFFDLMEHERNLLDERNEACSMHIHLNREGFCDLFHLGRMSYFTHRQSGGNRQLMNLIAERPCKFVAIKNPSEFKNKHKTKLAVHHSTYRPTVEVRLFRSTTIRNEFFRNLQFVHSLVRFTLPPVGKNHASVLNFENYYNWLERYQKEYPLVWEFLFANGEKILAEQAKAEEKEKEKEAKLEENKAV